eukprot:3823286-Rhodomonas_salina.2
MGGSCQGICHCTIFKLGNETPVTVTPGGELGKVVKEFVPFSHHTDDSSTAAEVSVCQLRTRKQTLRLYYDHDRQERPSVNNINSSSEWQALGLSTAPDTGETSFLILNHAPSTPQPEAHTGSLQVSLSKH